MTFSPNIPQGTDQPSQSQSQILTNFQQINTVFGANHVSLIDSTVANRGKHNIVVMPQQASGAATNSTEGALYTKALGGAPNLYWRRNSNGAEIPMTSNVTPSSAANGFTFLPGNMLMQWGTTTIPVGLSSSIPFATAFSVAPYSIVCTFLRSSGTTTVGSVYISSGDVTTTRFKAISAGFSGPHDIYWIAIGPA